MEKKSRKSIIVGITILLLVTVTLLGLTYAYYRTRVIGNDEETSISVTSKKLEITYSDETAVLNMEGKIAPGFKYNKTFYVENTGDGEANYGVYLENLVNEFKRTSDWKLRITCTSNIDGNTCNGVTEIDFPSIESLVLMNEIETTEKQTYEMEIEYLDLSEDQSIDMGKNLSARIQIYDLTNTLKTNTLASKLVNNAMNGTGSTTYRVEPLSIPAQETTRMLEQTEGKTTTIALTDASYYTYAAEVEFNELSGYSLVNPQVDTWASIKANPQKLANFKYLRSESGAATLTSERTQTIKDMVRVDNVSGSTMTYTMLELQATEQSVESTLSATRDDYGVSFYYRGDVEDNYVNYNGMCWRIMRVEGDGAIKLILASSKGECSSDTLKGLATDAFVGTFHFGYDVEGSAKVLNYANGSDDTANSMRTKLNNWFNENNFDTTYLREGNWCLGNVTDAYNFDSPYALLTETPSQLHATNTSFYYEGMKRLYRQNGEEATLLCDETSIKLNEDYVGSVTADELVIAGEKHGYNTASYLIDDVVDRSNLASNYFFWLTLTPAYSLKGEDHVEAIHYKGSDIVPKLTVVPVSRTTAYYTRPVIILNSSVLYASGNGTIASPYTITK